MVFRLKLSYSAQEVRDIYMQTYLAQKLWKKIENVKRKYVDK